MLFSMANLYRVSIQNTFILFCQLIFSLYNLFHQYHTQSRRIKSMNNQFLLFVLCGIIIGTVIYYFVVLRKPKRRSHMETSQVRRNRQALGDDECCICLAQQKRFQVSVTCGHSFCGKCLLDLYNHSNEKLKCPLCRDDINVIFKVFHDEEPQQEGRKISQQIREYNHKFSDNRSFLRKFTEFPFVLRALSDRLFTIDFIRYFFSTANLLKMTGTMMLYLVSPIDVLPELILGPIGYLDDLGFIVVVFLYTVANSAVEYVRSRE